MKYETLVNAIGTRGMSLAEQMAYNIIDRFAVFHGRQVTDAEGMEILDASRKVMGKIRGRLTRKFVASSVGAGNGLARFEGIALGEDTDILRAVHKEAMEAMLYPCEGKYHAAKANEAFIREWRDGSEADSVLGILELADNANARAQRTYRKRHPGKSAEYMREYRRNH